jgi:hypothetical protein
MSSNKLHNLISLNNLQKLRGTHQAMIIDQEANLQIFSMALVEIEMLEIEIEEKFKLIQNLAALVDSYQSDVIKLTSYIFDGFDIPIWNLLKQLKHRTRGINLMKECVDSNKMRVDEFKKLRSKYSSILEIKKR